MLKSEGHADLALPFTGPRIAGPAPHGTADPKIRKDGPTPYHGSGRPITNGMDLEEVALLLPSGLYILD